LQPVGRLPGANRLNLAIGLPLRNQAELTALLEQLYDPASPQYRHYLTPEQFTERFGPTPQDYEAVIAFAKAHGLSVTGTHPNRTLLDISGAVLDIEQAFHVHLQVYQHPTEDRMFHAPDVEPSLDLAVPILHISGLSDLSRPRSRTPGMAWGPTGLRPASGGSSPGGGFMGDDFRDAYVPGVTLTGAGQSIALVEFDGYFPSDITDYETLTGRTNVPLHNVLLDGADGSAGSNNSEVALDIEMAISMAPGLSRVIVYEAPNNSAYVNDLLNRIATDNLARQISCSWFSYTDFGDRTNTEQVFQQYAAQGQSFFEISGDFDAYPSSYLSASGTPNGFPDPCDSPYVTIVGGTELNMTGPGGDWLSESVWNIGYSPAEGYSVGSSGGISPTYPIPSWQHGIDMTANHGSSSRRNIPDVAMVADNIWVYARNGLAYASWGTSASTPLWAGFTALANELAATKGQPAIGFINPTIYALGSGSSYHSTFHDITVGDNNSSSSQTGFPAVPGYDLCTGWGTPNGSNLLYALAFPEFLHITPQASFTAGGPVGGPFLRLSTFGPATATYSLTNSGSQSIAWAVGSSAPWLNASLASGTLAAGDPATTVSVSPNAAANSLALGTYPGTVWFTNLNDGSVQSRLYTLVVQPTPQTAPVIVSQTTNVAVLDGGTAVFTVQVTPGSLPVAYNWIRNGILLTDGGNISGATTGTLTISNVSAAEVGNYSVVIMNSIGAATGYLAILTLASPPVIVTDTTNQTVLPGDSATFAVGAIGTKPFSYQWQSNGTNIIGAANTNVLTLRNVSIANAGAYSVVVSNVLGSVTNGGATLSLVPVTVPDAGFASLYSFTGGSDGANPNGLVMATNGLLYGSAILGGSSNAGTLFRITTNGVLTTLHTFSGRDGGTPRAGLIQARDGYFYGTTSSGGQNSAGTVFRMFFNGGFVTLHTFGFNDGASSMARLTQATDGNLYGTTSSGGSNGYGTVFKMTPNGGLTSLHAFSGDADGSIPLAGVTQGNDGNFFGVVRNGGGPHGGKAFKISATGAFTVLAEFGGTNGLSPRGGLVQAPDGNFYGTTYHGGALGRGTVFRITPAGLLTTIHSFNGEGDGYWPLATLVEGHDGYLYGATSFGGKGFNGSEFSGQGTLFRISPKGQLTTLVYFDGFNGANPDAPLVQAPDGSYYGTTLNGGANGNGTVFRLSVPALSLSIALSGNQIVLSWPSWASDLVLQQTSDLSVSNWTTVTNSSVTTNQMTQVILAPEPSAKKFFRLAH
jgi:uncharacterized repeat protein (TIGR03803 family)